MTVHTLHPNPYTRSSKVVDLIKGVPEPRSEAALIGAFVAANLEWQLAMSRVQDLEDAGLMTGATAYRERARNALTRAMEYGQRLLALSEPESAA